jgi:hypothetical protein
LALTGVLLAQGRSDEGLARAIEAQERHTERLMELGGVVGTAVGLDESAGYAVLVLTESPGLGGIPDELDGVPVRPVVTGTIYALPKPIQPQKPGKPPIGTPPSAPDTLVAAVISSSQISLQWFDKANNEKGFKIECAVTGSFVQIATVGANQTTYSDTGLAPSITYTYRVLAYNDAGNSDYSNSDEATTGSEESPFARPASIGVSTGHPDITAGTIGCRVTDGTNVYALSNNHVYADENRASIGDNVLQPGPYDWGQNPRDAIGVLADFEPIVFSRRARNTIDAAIAITSAANLGTATPLGGYGQPASTPVVALVNQPVKKYGRTTGLTTGSVFATNATVDVQYSRGIARFVNQIVITPGAFSAGGDSGSLIVTDDDACNPVGLLFAGSSSYTIANPIGAVLARFGVDVDGQ